MSWLSQRWLSHALVGLLVCVTSLAGCGGGQQPPHGSPDTAAPTFSSASATKPTADQVLVRAEASDNGLVTGYCAKATLSTPQASDGCFTTTQPLSVDTSGLTTSAKVYVWARDAAGNVSGARAIDVNQCSEQGQSTANGSAYAQVVCMGVGAINGSHSGEILIGLEPSAPNSAANFLAYVNAGFYPGTVFHRVLSTFMAQAGGSTFASGTYSQKTTGLLSPVALERTTVTGLSNTQYTVALARGNTPDSATSQFFINVVDNLQLNANGSTDPGNGYAVFGRVIAGTSTVDAIKTDPVGSNGATQPEISQPTGTPPTILYAVKVK